MPEARAPCQVKPTVTTPDMPSPPPMPAPARPAPAARREVSLDVLRGVALLGILVMNIQSFSMPSGAYLVPYVWGDMSGLNYLAWLVSHLFFDQKMMTIFSMLFGAGIVLMTDRPHLPADTAVLLHYRRTCALLVIGFLHAYLLWYGDILFPYAVCALFLFWARRWPAPVLLVTGIGLIGLNAAIMFLIGLSYPFWPAEAQAEFNAIASDVTALEEVAIYQGSWLGQFIHRVPEVASYQLVVLPIWLIWRLLGTMLLGMALFKWGVFTAQRSWRVYVMMIAAGVLLGVPMVAVGIRASAAAGWQAFHVLYLSGMFNYFASFLVALAWVGLVMLACQSPLVGALRPLAAVGQMALTNYLGQTVICTTLFYGFGLGLFGAVPRWQQALIVLGVWGVQMVASTAWLRVFRFGPVEWLWRSVTYWKLQPLRRGATSPAGSS